MIILLIDFAEKRRKIPVLITKKQEVNYGI